MQIKNFIHTAIALCVCVCTHTHTLHLSPDLRKLTIYVAQQVNCILLLCIIDTLMHYPNTVIEYQEMTRSALIST